jgi:predicted Zn-dependent protease with MMP-like domain
MALAIPATAVLTTIMVENSRAMSKNPAFGFMDQTLTIFKQALTEGVPPDTVGNIVAHVLCNELTCRLDNLG